MRLWLLAIFVPCLHLCGHAASAVPRGEGVASELKQEASLQTRAASMLNQPKEDEGLHLPASTLQTREANPHNSRVNGSPPTGDQDQERAPGDAPHRARRPGGPFGTLPPIEDPAPSAPIATRRYRIIGRHDGHLVAQLQRTHPRRNRSPAQRMELGDTEPVLHERFPDRWHQWQPLTPEQGSASLAVTQFPRGWRLSLEEQRALIAQTAPAFLTREEHAVLVHFLRAFRVPERSRFHILAKRDASRGVVPPRPLRNGPAPSQQGWRYRIVRMGQDGPLAELDHLIEMSPGISRVQPVIGPAQAGQEPLPPQWQRWQQLTPSHEGQAITILQFPPGGPALDQQQRSRLFDQATAHGLPLQEAAFLHTYLSSFRFPASPHLAKRGEPLSPDKRGRKEDHHSGPPPKNGKWFADTSRARPRIHEYRIIGIRESRFVAQLRTEASRRTSSEVHNMGFPPPRLDVPFDAHPWTEWQRLTPAHAGEIMVPLVDFTNHGHRRLPTAEMERLVHELDPVRLTLEEEANLRRFLLAYRLPPHAPRLAKRGTGVYPDARLFLQSAQSRTRQAGQDDGPSM